MLSLFLFILIPLISFFATFLIMPSFIKRMKAQKLIAKDMNKFNETFVPEFGGIPVFFGFASGIMLSIFFYSYLKLINLNLTVLLAAFLTILLVGFIGLVDDLIGWKKGIKKWQHALFPVFAALPLMAIKINNPPFFVPLIGFLPSQIVLPFIGAISFGVFYSLFFVPLGITGAANASNMIAGMNGLEAGLGLIIIGTLSIITFQLNEIEAFILCIALIGSLLAFLFFNWFPAKIFPGDTLTLMVGASIASIVIIADIEKIGLLLFSLYFIELIFKAKHGFKSECFGLPQKNGTLKPLTRDGSITQLIMHLGNFTEKQVVSIILLIQLIISIIVLFLFYFNLIVI